MRFQAQLLSFRIPEKIPGKTRIHQMNPVMTANPIKVPTNRMVSQARTFSIILFQLLCVLVPNVSEASQSLAGEWRYAPDPADLGIGQGWAAGKFDGTIDLPGSTDEAGLGDLQSDTGKTMGHLVRKHNYLGAVWFAREIIIPENPAAEDWTLTLERVMWQSRVLVDGKEAGAPQDSLCTPHIHRLGKLSPGKHLLAIRVDNRMIHPIGNKCHAYGEQTQSRWNGIVGGIELTPTPETSIASLRVFTTERTKRKSKCGFLALPTACGCVRPLSIRRTSDRWLSAKRFPRLLL